MKIWLKSSLILVSISITAAADVKKIKWIFPFSSREHLQMTCADCIYSTSTSVPISALRTRTSGSSLMFLRTSSRRTNRSREVCVLIRICDLATMVSSLFVCWSGGVYACLLLDKIKVVVFKFLFNERNFKALYGNYLVAEVLCLFNTYISPNRINESDKIWINLLDKCNFLTNNTHNNTDSLCFFPQLLS